jgi:hypothetical protein
VADPAIQRMRAAVREARSALQHLRDQIQSGQAALGAERQQLEDAERRGRMARGIGDAETAEIAERFARRHAERAAVLERKVAVLGEEAALLERDLAEMIRQLDETERAAGAAAGGGASARTAEYPAGGARTPAEEDEVLRARMDRAAREKAAEDQLAAIKRKMGR